MIRDRRGFVRSRLLAYSFVRFQGARGLVIQINAESKTLRERSNYAATSEKHRADFFSILPRTLI